MQKEPDLVRKNAQKPVLFIVSIHGSGLGEHLLDLSGEQTVFRSFQQRVCFQQSGGLGLKIGRAHV